MIEQIDEKIQKKAKALGLNEADVVESFVRGSGAGGQKINKTSSTVVLRHLPSGLEVRSQRFREQSNNRLDAWKNLIMKLEERQLGRKSDLARARFKVQKQKQRRKRKTQLKLVEDKRRRGEVKAGRGGGERIKNLD